MADTRITDAEIAGHMGWRGPAAYTDASLRKIRGIVDHVLRAERAAVSEMHEKDLRDVFNLAWDQALSDAAFYADSHCGVDEHHLEHMLELVPPKLRVRGAEIASRPDEVYDEGLPALPEATMLGTSRHGSIFRGYTAEQFRQGQRDAVAADRAQREKLPANAEEMVAFIGSHYNSMTDDKPDPNDIVYELTVHDLLSAFRWWFDDYELEDEPSHTTNKEK